MATEIKLRRGTKAQHDDGSGFTGAEGELTVDTTNDTVRVHDGSTKGGHRLAKYTEVQASNELSEMLDVNLTSPADGSVLKYDNASSKWIDSSKLTETATGIDVTGSITVSGNVDGRDVAADGLVLDAIEAGADVTDTTNVVAALTAGTNITIAGDGTISSTDTNTTYSVQDGELSQNNFTNDDHDKLNGIEASADVTDTTNVVAALTAGTNIAIAGNGTISATDTTYSVQDGELSQNNFTNDDHTKLNDIEAGADVTDSTNVVAALAAGNNIAIASDGTISSTNTQYTGGTGLTLDGTTFNVDASQTHITSVGALDAGSITSGFGNINNGTNSITTLGNLYAGSTTLGAATINGNLEVVSTITDSNFLPEIRLKRAGSLEAGEDGDVLGALVFEGDSFDGSQKDYARIGVSIKDDGTGVSLGQVKGEIRFACADGDGGSPTLESPSARIDHQGIHTNESIIDGTGNKNFFHTHKCGSGGGLKFHSNDGNHTTTIKAKNPTADQEITIPNIEGDIVVAAIAGGSINGGGDTTTPRTTWSLSQFVANPNSTYVHFNDGNTNDLTISVPFVGVDAVTIGASFKFINASPSDSDIIIDIDGFTFSGTAAYALTKLDGSANSVIYSNGSNLTIDSGGQITLTAVSAGVWLVEGIGYA